MDSEDEILGPVPQTPGRAVTRYFNLSTNRKRRRDSDEIQIISRFPVKRSTRLHERGTNVPERKASSQQAIVIEDDDDLLLTLQRACEPANRNGDNSISGIGRQQSLIDLTDDDFVADADFHEVVRRLSLEHERARAVASAARKVLPVYVNPNPRFKCAPGKCVELKDGSFLRVKSILQDQQGQVFVQGDHLVRQNYRGSLMSKRRNEVIMIRQQLKTGGPSASHEVSISEILKNRDLVYTNQRFPSVSSRDDGASFSEPLVQVALGPLFCRWVHTTVVDENYRPGERRHSIEHILEHLGPENADEVTREDQSGDQQQAQISRNEVRDQWRGFATQPGGAQTRLQYTFNSDGSTRTSSFVHSYSFADAFCGAGGASRGAVDAGLVPQWSFDNNLDAIESYRRNFERLGADCRHESVDEFLGWFMTLDESEKRRVRVDVLHASPPCQPFSPAHTIASPERDEMNQAALPSVWHLIEELKPRVVTLEETEGLFSRHSEWFGLLINIFTTLGYSVRWKIAQCNEYGVPQTRKRLLIIAAGPGEILPPFPKPTHSSQDRSLKPLATIDSAIAHIPENANNHDQTVRFADGKPRVPFNGSSQAKTLTTNGGQGNHHPSGQRPYTVRELARLQTFPLLHSFDGARGITELKRQVGNAVPPLLAKAMFRSVVKSLKESDAVSSRHVHVH